MPIVSAVGIAVHDQNNNVDRAKRIEAAMAEAVMKAHEAGITDHDEIRRLILEAKENYLDNE